MLRTKVSSGLCAFDMSVNVGVKWRSRTIKTMISARSQSRCVTDKHQHGIIAAASSPPPPIPRIGHPLSPPLTLLQRNKPRTMRSTNTRPTMLDRLVTDTELGQIMPHHLRLDLDLVEFFAAVHTNDATNHLRNDNHVAQVSLDQIGLLVGLGFLFGLAQFLDETHGAAFQAAVEAAAGAGVKDGEEVGGGDIEESKERRIVSCCAHK